jgi:hypothetical protein
MKSKSPLDLIFYLLLLAPPRGSKKGFRSKSAQGMHNKKNEIIADYFLEYLTRLGILVVIFYGITESVSKFYFDYYKIVFITFTFISIGTIHTIAYYIHTEIYFKKHPRIYNVVKISLYSTLPGFIPVAGLIIYREINQIKIFADDAPFYLYGAFTLAAIIISTTYYGVRSRRCATR